MMIKYREDNKRNKWEIKKTIRKLIRGFKTMATNVSL